MSRSASPTDLTDAQWAVFEPLVPAPKPGGRPAAQLRLELITAKLYMPPDDIDAS